MTESLPPRVGRLSCSSDPRSMVTLSTSRRSVTRLPFGVTVRASFASEPLNESVSAPSSPSILSLPSPGTQRKVSSPGPPEAVSGPIFGSTLSSPAPPCSVSGPLLPMSWSLPSPPSTTVGLICPKVEISGLRSTVSSPPPMSISRLEKSNSSKPVSKVPSAPMSMPMAVALATPTAILSLAPSPVTFAVPLVMLVVMVADAGVARPRAPRHAATAKMTARTASARAA